MAVNKNLPVDVLVVEPTAIEGEHIGVGTRINKMDADLAMDLAGSGKVRLYTKELEKDLDARVKAEQAAAKKREEQGNAVATFVPTAAPSVSGEDLAAAVQAGIAQGIEAGLKLIAEAGVVVDEVPAEESPHEEQKA
jgi:hypothetical protein